LRYAANEWATVAESSTVLRQLFDHFHHLTLWRDPWRKKQTKPGGSLHPTFD
jgi:hypothetical protein